jgi:hypothetical protein
LNQKTINELHKSFKTFDVWINQQLNLKLDYDQLNKDFRRWFISVSLTTVVGIIFFLQSCYVNGFTSFSYACQLVPMTILINLQLLQLTMYSRCFRNRLEILSEFEFEDSEDQMALRKALLKLHDINQNFNNCFRFPIFFSLFQIYGGFLLTFYWIGLSVLGLSSEVILDSLSFGIPCAMVLNFLLQTDKSSRKALRRIVGNSMNAQWFSPQSKELVMQLNHCRFFVSCFGFFDASFGAFGKVSWRMIDEYEL